MTNMKLTCILMILIFSVLTVYGDEPTTRHHQEKHTLDHFDVSSVCFPVQMVTGTDFLLYKSWKHRERSNQKVSDSMVNPTTLISIEDMAEVMESVAKKEKHSFNRQKRSVESPSLSEKPKRRVKRYPAHINRLFRDFNFLKRKECPIQPNGKKSFLCPSKDNPDETPCITTAQFCDGFNDCPNGEDEDERNCFFFRPMKYQYEELLHSIKILVNKMHNPIYFVGARNKHWQGSSNGQSSASLGTDSSSKLTLTPVFNPKAPLDHLLHIDDHVFLEELNESAEEKNNSKVGLTLEELNKIEEFQEDIESKNLFDSVTTGPESSTSATSAIFDRN